MIEMKVAGIAIDALSRNPVILLKDVAQQRRALPIFVGQDQARIVITILERQTLPRPMTHDLMINTLTAIDAKIDRVIIHSLQENTFYALLGIRLGDIRKEIDARPSDAIILALQARAPIWATEEVIVDASIPVDREADEAERRAFRQFLSKIRPEDFIQRQNRSREH